MKQCPSNDTKLDPPFFSLVIPLNKKCEDYPFKVGELSDSLEAAVCIEYPAGCRHTYISGGIIRIVIAFQQGSGSGATYV